MFRDYGDCGDATGGYMDIIPTLLIGTIMLIIFFAIFTPILNTINPTNTSQPNITDVKGNDHAFDHMFDVFKTVDYTLLFNIIMLIVGLYIGYLIFKYLICYHPFRHVRYYHREDEKTEEEKKSKKKAPRFVHIDMHDLKPEERNDSIFNKDNEQESEPHWKVFKKR
jgi:hypothetical protein